MTDRGGRGTEGLDRWIDREIKIDKVIDRQTDRRKDGGFLPNYSM